MKCFKWLLYLSSYFPLMIMLFLNEMGQIAEVIDEEKVIGIIGKAIVVFNLNRFFWIFSAFVIVLALIVLFMWLRSMRKEARSKGKKYDLGVLKSSDGEVINYFVTYLIPVLSLRVTSLPSIIMNLILIAVVGVYFVFVSNNYLHFNVMLLLTGYHVYTDEMENIVISKLSKHEIQNRRLKADQIGTSSIYYII